MSKTAYLAALERLGLSVGSQETAHVLGLSQRQLTRYATGKAKVTGPLQRLIEVYLKKGIPREIR